MDSLGLDALVYPTMRRRPVVPGDVQLGSTCALSAQTGLPALSIPAGFTSDGLPVGIELLGRAFGDVQTRVVRLRVRATRAATPAAVHDTSAAQWPSAGGGCVLDDGARAAGLLDRGGPRQPSRSTV